jgi:hypothetical protein
MKNNKTTFNVTPEIKETLCKEIAAYFEARGLDHWTKKRQSKAKTGLPISWRYIWDLNNLAPADIEIKPTVIFNLFNFFGYELIFKFKKTSGDE